MTWYSVMGFISSVALFLPVILILTLRLSGYRSFPALLIYFALVFVYSLFTAGYVHADREFVRYWGLGNNLLDAPLMLFFLTYFSPSPSLTKLMRRVILVLLIFDVIVVSLMGFNVKALTVIMAPGLTIVFGFCLHFFVRQSKITIMHRKAMGKALIAASQLFAYGCYAILYLMYYVFNKILVNSANDIFLIYFLVTILSSSLICVGIVLERKRIQKLHELKLTRKELSMVYKETKTSSPMATGMLDFDREQWN